MPRIATPTPPKTERRLPSVARRGVRDSSMLESLTPPNPRATETIPSRNASTPASTTLNIGRPPRVTCSASQVEAAEIRTDAPMANRTGSSTICFGSASAVRRIESGFVPAPNVIRVSGCLAGGSLTPAMPPRASSATAAPWECATTTVRSQRCCNPSSPSRIRVLMSAARTGLSTKTRLSPTVAVKDALSTEERAPHRGNGQQPDDRHDHERQHEQRREQQAEEQFHERERGGEPLGRVAGLGEPVALGDVARQRPRQRAQAPGDQLEVRRGQERLGPPSFRQEPVVGFP